MVDQLKNYPHHSFRYSETCQRGLTYKPENFDMPQTGIHPCSGCQITQYAPPDYIHIKCPLPMKEAKNG